MLFPFVLVVVFQIHVLRFRRRCFLVVVGVIKKRSTPTQRHIRG